MGVHNDTVVVDTAYGELNNKHRFVTDQYDVPCIYLYEQDFEWFEYKPKQPVPGAGQGLPGGRVHPQGAGRA